MRLDGNFCREMGLDDNVEKWDWMRMSRAGIRCECREMELDENFERCDWMRISRDRV